MKSAFLPTAVAMLIFALAQSADAEIKFMCKAQGTDECAFSVMPPGGGGATNFVLKAGKTHGLNDQFAGGRYCVVASAPGAQVRDWPPKCINAKDGKPGKIVENIKAGGTYD